jgi:tRNA U34 5-methylaminomethyl-2-thiouridine-forming methyltransferase MnmC
MKKAISKSVWEANQFISNIFIVEKKNGKFRPVLNFMKLNEFISYHHFKMETLDVVLASIN